MSKLREYEWDIEFLELNEGNIANVVPYDYPLNWNELKLKAINRAYAPPAGDMWLVKDQIIEIGKIAKNVDGSHRYTELYRDVKSKTYAYWHHEFDSMYWSTVINQVGKSIVPGVASIAISMIPGAGQVLAPIVYSTIYFLEVWLEQLGNEETASNLERSYTYYDIDDLKMRGPDDLNEKTRKDIKFADSGAKHLHHSSAYYYTVTGGEPGKDYTAELVIAPQKIYRGNGITFEGYNLDYFLLTSELAALKDIPHIRDVIIGTSPKPYFGDIDYEERQLIKDYLAMNERDREAAKELVVDIDLMLKLYARDRARDVYNDYRLNTIGALEQLVKKKSNDQFDTIRPYFVNGVPEYKFVHSKDIERTQSLSPLYSPIIVSQERYNQMVRDGEYTQSEIIIDLNSVGLSRAYPASPSYAELREYYDQSDFRHYLS